jgi:hypothetical protein
MKGGEQGLQDQHDERKTQRGAQTKQRTNDHAQYRE